MTSVLRFSEYDGADVLRSGCPLVLAPSSSAARRSRRFKQAFSLGARCVRQGAPGLSVTANKQVEERSENVEGTGGDGHAARGAAFSVGPTVERGEDMQVAGKVSVVSPSGAGSLPSPLCDAANVEREEYFKTLLCSLVDCTTVGFLKACEERIFAGSVPSPVGEAADGSVPSHGSDAASKNTADGFPKVCEPGESEEDTEAVEAWRRELKMREELSWTSVSVPPKDSNPLDVVYEVLAELSQRDEARAVLGWVDVDQVVEKASAVFGCDNAQEIVHEALDNWACLDVMVWLRCRRIRNGQLLKTRKPEESVVKFSHEKSPEAVLGRKW